MTSRMSMYSVMSEGMGGPRGPGHQPAQVSTTTLLNAVHNIYLSSQPYYLDAGASLVVNTWLTASQVGPDGRAGGTVDAALATRAWEHARRRAEDGCVILGSLHKSAPSVLRPFLSNLPFTVSPKVFTAIDAIEPFLRCVTPYNASAHRQTALAVTLTLNLAGNLTSASLALASGGIDTDRGLLKIPAEPGYRAFDVLYYLLTSASTPAEREFLSLKAPSQYRLLAPSGTYEPPSYLPTADDAAAADDFRSALKEIGIKGSAHRNLITVLAGLLKLGDTVDYHVDGDVLDEVCEDVGGLLGVEPEVLARKLPTEDRRTLLAGLYEALVDWVISRANAAVASSMGYRQDGDESVNGESASRTGPGTEDNGDTVCLHVIEIPDLDLSRAVAMRGIFDDGQGINSEMKQDGIDVAPVNSSVLRDMQTAVAECGPELGIMIGTKGRERQHQWDKREEVLEKVGLEAEEGGFLKKLLFPVPAEGINLGRAGRVNLPSILASSRAWYHLSVHPTDDSPASLAALPSVTSAWSAGTVSRQLRAWRLPEWANRRNRHLDFTADFDLDEFAQRYGPLGCLDGREGINNWILERGWTNGEVVVGHERVWIRENAWWEAESMLDLKPTQEDGMEGGMLDPQAHFSAPTQSAGLETSYSNTGSGFFPPTPFGNSSSDQLMPQQRNASQATSHRSPPAGAPSIAQSAILPMQAAGSGDYGLGHKGDDHKDKLWYNADGQTIGLDPDLVAGKHLEERPISPGRKFWVAFVWALTFWIPSPLLSFIGRMKRPDVRMAWREKLVLCFLIILANGVIVFWIIEFGRLLCPNYDKAWTQTQVATHQGDADFWVSIHGGVYDISKFWKKDHSDVPQATTDSSTMQPFAGMNLDEYFVPPLPLACPGLGIANTTMLQPNSTPEFSSAEHYSGHFALYSDSVLASFTWYTDVYEPAIKEYYHGQLVWDTGAVASDGANNNHMWFIYDSSIYDMTDYFYTLKLYDNTAMYEFLDPDIVSAVDGNPGGDLTDTINSIIADSNTNATKKAQVANSMNCIKNSFFIGVPDFRNSARCQANNYILLAFMILLCIVILAKFLAALQFGSKRRPAPQDKFVICQVPAYTEGEDSLRKALDSLTALQYDNKRKLICVICDGVVTGSGNDRPTAKIVLDILGVDPKVDPPSLPFKSVGNGAEQLNYGKVFSGLYEYEGNVVPYLVLVKVGKDSEQDKPKPGNRGKRDSQIAIMSFLNRVHHRAPMNPLELEMFHQINNVIGVDPELYEYLLMVDADTCVREDSLNRLVAKCANDAKIAGICGETSLQNEERSWWTMIQVYEYFISHHLAKAFESLFGSVTCLPGCFSMYRLRTADRGKPLIIADSIIREYSDCNVDTLHKKNLLSLGEDRYLTTLMTKHFPFMSYKFIPDAYCQTAAPEQWSVLLSQRRRWINSTIHNLVELMWVKEMCGFCCFSMRFVVFIDLTGTILLPATTVYLVYLIIISATADGQFPIISIIMLSAVYGLQALIFILKRQWQHIGWMIIYLLAFPIYSFVLPLYSFWNQDNFSWGNTRIVIGESGSKQVLAVDDEGFDPRSIPLQRWDDYALENNLPGRRGAYTEKMGGGGGGGGTGVEDAYEMDDIKSVYSSVRQASILTGLQGHNAARNTYMPPQSPGTPMFGRAANTRSSMFPGQVPYSDNPAAQRHSIMSQGGGADLQQRSQSPFADNAAAQRSTGNLRNLGGLSAGMPSAMNPNRSSAMLGVPGGGGRATPQPRVSSALSMDYQRGDPLSAGGAGAPDDLAVVEAIQAVLQDVDLDTVTKKQVRALVEQRLQTELVGERRTFMDRQIDNELANM